MSFGKRLRERREALQMTQAELGARLGVLGSAVSNYENDVSSPKAEVLHRLFDVLDCDANTLFQDEMRRRTDPAPPPIPFPDAGLGGKYYRLNDQGQLMAMEYLDFLLTRHALIPEEEPEDLGEIRLYLHAPAAGYSSPAPDEDYINIPRTRAMPKGADYCLNISGDSMEPYLHDRQRVYVQRTQTLEEGEVGIWSWQGETYCKLAVEDVTGAVLLLSANPAREDANKRIPADQVSELRCLGRVILPQKLPLPHYD